MRCSFIKQNNQQCQAQALKQSSYCFTHDPNKSEERSLAVRKGGLAKKRILLDNQEEIIIKDSKDAKNFLSKLIDAVWRGKIPATPVANTLGFLVRCFLDAYEKSDLEKRITKLEEKITNEKEQVDFNFKDSLY